MVIHRLDLPRFILLNGPTGAGKTTLSTLIEQYDPSNIWVDSFALPLRDIVYNVFFREEVPTPSFDIRLQEFKVKNIFRLAGLDFEDRPITEIPELDIRDTMIESAEFLRDHFGKDILGRLLLRRATDQAQWYRHFIIDDCGFPDETNFIVQQAGPDNCHLIRIHRSGYEFGRDGRNYLSLNGVQTLDLQNDGEPDEMMQTVAAEFRPAEPPELGAL